MIVKENTGKSPGLLIKGVKFFSKFIDFTSAIAGALIMGFIVGYINRKFGAWPATTAALKQGAYTFLFGGMLTKLLYVIVGKIPGKYASSIISSLIVSLITVALVYAVHSMKGTPMPLESTVPTAILAPIGFAFLAYRKKESLDLRLKTNDQEPGTKNQ